MPVLADAVYICPNCQYKLWVNTVSRHICIELGVILHKTSFECTQRSVWQPCPACVPTVFSLLFMFTSSLQNGLLLLFAQISWHWSQAITLWIWPIAFYTLCKAWSAALLNFNSKRTVWTQWCLLLSLSGSPGLQSEISFSVHLILTYYKVMERWFCLPYNCELRLMKERKCLRMKRNHSFFIGVIEQWLKKICC